MYNKLTRSELRIIEETKKEAMRQDGQVKTTAWQKIKPLVFFMLVFFLIAFLGRLVFILLA